MRVRSLLLAAALLSVGSAAHGGDFRFTPVFGLSEEVNDNIHEVPENSRFESITRVQPGGALHYLGGHSLLDASYNLDYRHYARNTRGDEFNHAASLKGVAGLLNDFLTLDVSDTYTRVSLDIARETVAESAVVNQTDQNIATLSPYLTWQLGGKSTLRTGYRFSDIRYWQSSAIDKEVHTGFVEYTRQLSDLLSINANYSFSRTSTSFNHYLEHDVSAGFRYAYRDASFLYASIGNSWLDFSNGPRSSNLFWNAGVTNDFGVVVATLETRVQYTEDPLYLATKETDYTFKLDKALKRGRIGMSAGYSEYHATLGDVQDRRRTQVTVGGDHEIVPGLVARLTLTGDRQNRESAYLNLPYHLVATGALSYTIGDGLTLGFTYSHISYRESLGNSDGSVEVNRGIVDMRKTF